MSGDELRAALADLHLRVPQSVQEAEALRAEVRAADAALGRRLKEATARRHAAADVRRSGGPR